MLLHNCAVKVFNPIYSVLLVIKTFILYFPPPPCRQYHLFQTFSAQLHAAYPAENRTFFFSPFFSPFYAFNPFIAFIYCLVSLWLNRYSLWYFSLRRYIMVSTAYSASLWIQMESRKYSFLIFFIRCFAALFRVQKIDQTFFIKSNIKKCLNRRIPFPGAARKSICFPVLPVFYLQIPFSAYP